MALLEPTRPATFNEHPWWKANKGTAHESLWRTLEYLQELPEEVARMSADLDHARLYGNTYFRGLGASAYSKPAPLEQAQNQIRANVCRSVVDTATAQIAGRSRPRATLLTTDGSWSQRRRAKRADLFVEGVFRESGIYDRALDVFRDAGIFGTCALHIYAEFGRIKCERVLPCELLVDPVDGRARDPRCMYRIHVIDRSVLLELFGADRSAKRTAILEAGIVRDEMDASLSQTVTTTAQPIHVLEAWHLPSGPNATDGRHVISIRGCDLLDEEWKVPRFPFAFFRWSDRPVGFWGTGLVEEIRPIQVEINLTLRRIKECLHLMAVPRIFVQQASKAIKSMITNEVGAIIPYSGSSPPTFMVPPSVPPELFAHLRWQIEQAYQLPGVSQMAATSLKPAGLESGKALRAYDDMGSSRFTDRYRRYEKFHLDCAEIVMDVAHDLADGDAAGYAVTAVTRKAAQKVSWKDVKLDRDAYVLHTQSTSTLPRDVAGRTQTVAEWQSQGWIDATKAQRLLDLPDIDAETSLRTAAQDNADAKIERMLDHEPIEEAYIPPEPYDDLKYAIPMAQLTYQRESMAGAPEERLALLRDWIMTAQSLIPKPEPQAAMAAPAGPAHTQPQVTQ